MIVSPCRAGTCGYGKEGRPCANTARQYSHSSSSCKHDILLDSETVALEGVIVHDKYIPLTSTAPSLSFKYDILPDSEHTILKRGGNTSYVHPPHRIGHIYATIALVTEGNTFPTTRNGSTSTSLLIVQARPTPRYGAHHA